ncbi:MAG: GntR family transcriptional regulator [Chloroflexota bacterium]
MNDPRGKTKYTALSRPEHQSLADIAYNALVAAIVNQDFEPGAPLSIDGLAKQLAMSNTPVREALMRANGERLVEQKTNHGFVVANLLTTEELHQLFDVRYLLETYALSTARLNAAAIAEFKHLADQMDSVSDGAVYNDYKDYLLLDHNFHRTIVSLSENAFLLTAWLNLHVHLHLSRLYTGIGLFDRGDSATEHRAIVDQLAQGNRNRAVELLSQHIRRVEKRMKEFLSAQ